METTTERTARKRSHIVAYSTMFITSIGLSIVLSGVWPYLQELCPGIEKEKLGAIVAANPLGTMIASPLLGLWGNKLGSIRIPCLVTVVLFILGNTLYSIAGIFRENAYLMMLISRFIVGVSSANVALSRSYLSSSTTEEERTAGIATIAAAQALGFGIGTGIQTILTLSIPDTIDLGIGTLILDKYTAVGWVAVALGLINFIILMPGIFHEHNITEKERVILNEKNQSAIPLPKPNTIALTAILFGFFISLFTMFLLETLATPFVMDQYGWEDDFAVVIIGIVLAGGGMLSLFMFALSSILSKNYDERKILLIIGFMPLIIGTILYIPFTGEEIVIQTQCYNYSSVSYENSTLATADETSELIAPVKVFYASPSPLLDVGIPFQNNTDADSLLKEIKNIGLFCSEEYKCACGCPAEQQPWCVDTKALPIPQLIVAYIITVIGYPVSQSISQTLFSKMIGPRPQGLWMGILTSVGSLARILGPFFVSYVYAYMGPLVTFGIMSGLLIIASLKLILVYKRLIPAMLIEDDYKRNEL